MTKSLIAILLTIVCQLIGCDNQSADRVPNSNPRGDQEPHAIPEVFGRFIWDREDRPYVVIDFAEKDVVDLGVQHRSVRVVLESPKTKADAEATIAEIYRDLEADIEIAQSDAQYKRINILLYDSFADGEAYDGNQILHVSTTAGPAIPAWKDADVTWNWRDPKHRPSSEQLELFQDY